MARQRGRLVEVAVHLVEKAAVCRHGPE
jgi:hypothetical protein